MKVARPDRQERTNFLNIAFCQDEPLQRAMTYQKIMALRYSDPDILFVGDSSCGHGVIPHVAMQETPGFRIVNMGIATNVGYQGYLALAEFMLRKNPRIRYLVLYNMLCGGHPRPTLWDAPDLMSEDIHKNFVSRPHSWLQPPTLAARQDVFEYVAYRGGKLKRRTAPLNWSEGYRMLTQTARPCYGWARETDRPADFPDDIYFNFSDKAPKATDETYYDYLRMRQQSWIEFVYGKFADFARRRGVKLVVMHNPVPASARERFPNALELDKIEAALRRFAAANPDVHTLTALDYWPDEKFSVFSHVSTLHSRESSLRAGRVLKEVIARDGAAPRLPPDFVVREAVDRIAFDLGQPVCAYGWGPREGTSPVYRYVGVRDHAYLFGVVKAGRDYTVRVHFHTTHSPAAVDRLKVRVNDTELAEVWRIWAGWYAIDYRLPADVVSKHLGWMQLEIDFRAPPGAPPDPEPPGRKVAIKVVSVVPAGEEARK
jgi:hypothetical protein